MQPEKINKLELNSTSFFPREIDGKKKYGIATWAYAAVHLGVEVYMNPDLQEMIRRSNDQKLLQGVIIACVANGVPEIEAISKAYKTLDALKKYEETVETLTENGQ